MLIAYILIAVMGIILVGGFGYILYLDIKRGI